MSAAHLTVVTPNFVPKAKQVTKFIVVDPGVTYVKECQVLSLQEVVKLSRFFYSFHTPEMASNENYKVKFIPYNTKLHALLKKGQQLPSNVQTYIL